MSCLQENLESISKFSLTGYHKVKDLGKGTYGSTFLASNDDNNQIVIKQFFHSNEPNIEELIEREIMNLSFCKHDQLVIGFKGISFTDLDDKTVEYPLLIQSYAENGSLDSLMKKSKKNPELLRDAEKMIILYGTAKSMQYIHNFHIVHRDLKPGNIVLDKNYYPLLCDFGSSRRVIYTRTDGITATGTPRYVAPEVFKNDVQENFSTKSDVFSYTMVMYSLLTGKIPYEDLPNQSFFGISKYIMEGDRFFLPSSIPSYFRQLITLGWDKDPNERPSFSDIIDLFDAGVILPDVLSNLNYKDKYYKYTKKISNIGSFDKDNLIQLRSKFKKDNKDKLAAVITFFLADYFDDHDAQTEIGRCSFSGVILKLNQSLGFKYIERAANANHREALFLLGQAYENGIGVDCNSKKSLELYNKSSELGYQIATNYIKIQEEYKQVDKSKAPSVIIIGSAGSGKTTFVNKLVNIYNNSETMPTIGSKYYYIPCVDGNKNKFFVKICDTEGMEKFGPLLPNFCRDSKLALVMFDISISKSFYDIDKWITQLREYNKYAKLIIIGNKIDLEINVTKEEIISKVDFYDAEYLEVSALKGLCIEHAVDTISKSINSMYSQLISTNSNNYSNNNNIINNIVTESLDVSVAETSSTRNKKCPC